MLFIFIKFRESKRYFKFLKPETNSTYYNGMGLLNIIFSKKLVLEKKYLEAGRCFLKSLVFLKVLQEVYNCDKEISCIYHFNTAYAYKCKYDIILKGECSCDPYISAEECYQNIKTNLEKIVNNEDYLRFIRKRYMKLSIWDEFRNEDWFLNIEAIVANRKNMLCKK